MSNELRDLSLKVVLGQMNRRDFIGRAAALGVAAPLATQLLSGTARAAPVKGGHLILGYNGGQSTDSLDPGLAASGVYLLLCRNGEACRKQCGHRQQDRSLLHVGCPFGVGGVGLRRRTLEAAI